MAFPSRGLTHRSTVTGRRGLVAAAHPLASLAGVRILLEGGNAIDAAVATAAALNVAEPYMSGIGGVGYMHIYSARDGEHKVCDYVGLTPAAADLALYTEPDKKDSGPLSPLVPGACAGWLEALGRYGSMDAAAVFAPAIELAEGGFPLTVKNAWFFDSCAARLRRFPESAGTFLVDGRSPEAGEVLVQKDLAETYRTVAADGPEAFYRGPIGDAIAAHMAETGGLLTEGGPGRQPSPPGWTPWASATATGPSSRRRRPARRCSTWRPSRSSRASTSAPWATIPRRRCTPSSRR